jgi:hypothetical protein
MPFRLLFAALFLLPAATLGVRAADADASAEQVFEQRIRPIFNSPNPSSCVQCHLAGVDLKNYILPSAEKTFRSLRDQGLIDPDRPRESKILRLIAMHEAERAGPNLIHEQRRRAESEAFAAWIEASCRDPKLRDAPKLAEEERARAPRPAEVIRHARKDRLLESFKRNVWSMRFRCMSCHTEGTPENAKLVKEHGPRVAWVKSAGAEATMTALIKGGRLIDTDDPAKSPLLLKPLGEVKHGGGKKFLPGDLGYKGFRAWLEDYAATVNDRHAKASDLPKPTTDRARFGSDVWLKLTETPPEWGDKLLMVEVYAWDASRGGWEAEPVATSDRGVWGKGKLGQHNLTLSAAKGSPRAEAFARAAVLPPGRYLVRVYVDLEGRLGRDWTAALGPDDYAGQGEIADARWAPGYGKMTALDARGVRR